MPSFHQYSDEDLILQFKSSGDQQILSYFFKKYKRDLFGLAYYYVSDREIAMDLTMDTFEYIIEVIGTKEIQKFKAWALGIIRNKSLKYFRNKLNFEEIKDSHHSVMESDTSLELVHEDQLSALNKAIQDLKPDQRDCVVSFYLHGKSYREIAEQRSQDEKKVKSYIQNGKRNLYNILNKSKIDF